MKHQFTLGILGGAGPRSATLFQQYFLDAWSEQTGCFHDIAYPRIIMDTQALEGMDETGPVDEGLLFSSISKGVRRFKDEVDAFVVPCYSAHRVYSLGMTGAIWVDLRSLALDMIHGIVSETNPVVMFEAEGTHASRDSFGDLWKKRFGYEPLRTYHDSRYFLNRIIKGLMGSEDVSKDIDSLCREYQRTQESFTAGAPRVMGILGCSELSLAKWPMPVFNALKASAHGLVKLIMETAQ